MPRRSSNNRRHQLPERSRNRSGRYSTLNKAPRSHAQKDKSKKRKRPASLIVVASLVVILLGAALYMFFNWDNVLDFTSGKMLKVMGTPTPMPTPIAPPTPTLSPTPTPELTPSPTPIASPTPRPELVDITISAVGDLWFNKTQLEDALDAETNTYDFTHNFDKIAPSLQKSDLVIGTLKTTLSGVEHEYSGYPKYNTPESVLDALKGAGFDVLLTGHSNIFDQGWIGVERTNDFIKKAGMKTTGTYMNQEEYFEPLIVDVNGIKVAILNFTSIAMDMEKYIPSDKLKYCIKYAKDLRTQNITRDIDISREKGADVVIVSMHWGEEYKRAPSKDMKSAAQDILEAGADIILGTYPQVLQPIVKKSVTGNDKVTRTAVVAYSLGNFITSQQAQYRESGMILNISYQQNTTTGEVVLTGATYVPTWVDWDETDDSAKENFTVLPVGKYVSDPSLLGALSPRAQQRIQEVWNETQTWIGSHDAGILLE